MKMKNLPALAMASFLVSACAPWPHAPDKSPGIPPDPRIKCEASHPVCHITVRVEKCKVTVDPDWKHVVMRPGGVTMIWTIRDSSGVNFAHNGIVFKSRHEDASGPLFTPDRAALAGRTFVMHNSTSMAGKFPYTVNVVDNGVGCAPHDPGVVNSM